MVDFGLWGNKRALLLRCIGVCAVALITALVLPAARRKVLGCGLRSNIMLVNARNWPQNLSSFGFSPHHC